MRETEGDDAPKLIPGFVGALFSVESLLNCFKRQGEALVNRMMDLERAARERAVRS